MSKTKLQLAQSYVNNEQQSEDPYDTVVSVKAVH